MKIKYLLIGYLFPLLCQGQVVKNYSQTANDVNVNFTDGTLNISPIADNAVRIKYYRNVEAK
jgi:hypothetical protein